MSDGLCPFCRHPKDHHLSGFCLPDENVECPCERTFPAPRSTMSEKQLQDLVEALIKTMGLLGYHTYDSRRSQPGFPDLVIVGRNGVIYRELKTDKGKLTPMQVYWLDTLQAAGQSVGVWRPGDWPDRITRELRALSAVTTQKPQPTQAELRKKLASRSRK